MQQFLLLNPDVNPHKVYSYTYGGVYPGRFEPTLPLELATSRAYYILRQDLLRKFSPITLSIMLIQIAGAQGGVLDISGLVARIFNRPQARLRKIHGGVGKRGSLNSSGG